MRPITSSIGSLAYEVSKYMVSVLSPRRKNTFTVQNSSVFTQQIKQHSISSKEVMVSFDVKSLFTSIPVDLALTITKERLKRDQTLAECTNLSVDNILRLSDFVRNNNYFKYDGNHYKKIFGCAIGSPISSVLADLVLEEIEETVISTFPYPPKWWFRYVDDSHSYLKKDQVYKFQEYLNSVNLNIQFTLELENTNGQGLPFLDTITSGTEIHVDVYRKSTHTDRNLDFSSCHPLCHKRSVVNILLKKANNIPSTNKERQEETKPVKAVLRDNNYPRPVTRGGCTGCICTPPTHRTQRSAF